MNSSRTKFQSSGTTSQYMGEIPEPWNKKEWISAKEASEFMGISYGSVRNHVYRGQIPFYKFGSRLRFRVSELHSYMLQKQVLLKKQGYKYAV